MLAVQDVSKTYPQGGAVVHALRALSLRIDEPAFVAVMGPSGSGKSTLMHLLAGLDRADAGRIVVNGEDLGALPERRLTRFRRRNVGIVFQQFNLIPTLTARQNAALPGIVDGRPRRWLRERVDQLLDELGMTPRAEHRPEALSGGEQQRIAIARALLFEPPLILADEPTGALDAANSDRLWRLLGQVAETHGTTVLMVTHEPAAAAHCQRVYVLGDGRIQGQFETEGLDAGGVATRYQRLGG